MYILKFTGRYYNEISEQDRLGGKEMKAVTYQGVRDMQVKMSQIQF